MRPTEERSVHGYWAGDDRPDPLVAQSGSEFVTQLRALVQWSGLDLDEIEQLARANGDILPPSIVSAALSHHRLPPEEVVVALVAAIGDDDEMVELWASVLWRLEELEAAATTMAPQSMAPHGGPQYSAPPMQYSAPPMQYSAAPVSAVAAARQYSGGALAQAVQKRRNQNGWTGLHRGFQKGLRATGFGSKIGRRAAPVAVGAAFLVFVVGVAWAVMGGGPSETDNTAEPPSNACCVAGDGGSKASASPEAEVTPSGLPVVLPFPSTSTSTKASPTPKPSPTRNSPSPTQTQTQLNPVLTGNGNASACTNNGTDWVVDLSVSAILTGAPSGTNPQGQGGKSSDLRTIAFSGTGTANFSGGVDGIIVGPSAAAASGSLQWNVTVTVAGAGTVTDDGTASYNCPLPG